MKMHLLNILNQLGASEGEKNAAKTHFEEQKVSFSAVENFLRDLRVPEGIERRVYAGK
jgi:hydroxymethylglutaryl-CoA reductase